MPPGSEWIHGYLLTLNEFGTTLQALDALEDYDPKQIQNLYQRVMTEVFTPEE
jgi:gamma-glutamylcyclotransferase (GGCT)/AIG2-like uncharacterized protein YtfP